MAKRKKQKVALKLGERTKKILIIFLSLLCLAIILFNIKHWFVAALVNRQPITRYSLIRELEKEGGKQVLESLITKALILQEAKRQKIVVSKDELTAEIDRLEEQVGAQGGTLDDLLAMQGQTRKNLEEQIKVQLMVERILGQEIEISQEELEKSFEEQKEFFAEGTELEDVKGELEETLRQEKINEKFTIWLQELQEKAKIRYFLKF